MAKKRASRKLPDKHPDAGTHHRHDSVLRAGASSFAKSIIHAVVTKDEDLFFLTNPDGMIPIEPGHGLGLYYHDCRFLNGYELKIAGAPLDTLVQRAAECYRSVFQLANPDLLLSDGSRIPKETIGFRWDRALDHESLSLVDEIIVHNFGKRKVRLPIALRFSSHFEDVFEIRRVESESLGKRHKPEWKKGCLFFRYDGKDGVNRSAKVSFSAKPLKKTRDEAQFEIEVSSQKEKTLQITVQIEESKKTPKAAYRKEVTKPHKLREQQKERSKQWANELPEIHTSNPIVNDVLNRSFGDLGMLKGAYENEAFFSAGVPWYVTLFGRDSLVAALFNLPYLPEMAEDTLRLLAKHQGTRIDEWRDEEPGKILHELRRGEFANLNLIPQTPYYGTVDATPLFLLLLARHSEWTGNLSLFEELRPAVDAALNWMTQYGDFQGNGYLSYQCKSKKGLQNQGWKDSGDGIMNEDGSLAEPPIALVEVQGYVYAAKCAIASLFERSGEPSRAEILIQQAETLRANFNRDFWLTDKAFYALALQKGGRPAKVISSNPGHALWCGISDPDKAQKVVERLMQDDMFSGWGVRTLSCQEKRYNPMGYHLGSVWPHDNAILAAGFRRYGLDKEAIRIFESLMRAASFWQHFRLPELFSGFSSKEYGAPVNYPVACHPQAWAASSPPFLLAELLGLRANAFENTLKIVRPVLPEGLGVVDIKGLRAGKGAVDLHFEKSESGVVGVKVLRSSGSLEVFVETEPAGHISAAA